MRDDILLMIYIFSALVITFICYPLHTENDISIYEICFIILSFIFTVLLRNQSTRRKILCVSSLLIIKPFLVLADELYDPMTLLMGVPIDIILTGIGLLIGYVIAKIMMFLFCWIRNKVNSKKD